MPTASRCTQAASSSPTLPYRSSASKMMKAMLGTSNMVDVVPKESWGTALAPSFVLEGETLLLVLKSAEAEYAFTGVCDGEGA